MDCDWLLVCSDGERGQNEKQFPFHAATPEDAIAQARWIVLQEQKENVAELPFAPILVRAILYRGFEEFDGADFVVKKRPARADNQ